MAYIDGFVFAVPAANKDTFVKFARHFDAKLIEHGALRVVECWGDDVPHGKQTDFYRAVQATEDEVVAFSWVEWPDKATRDAVHQNMEALMASDEMDASQNGMPFDGARMVFGGFAPVLELGGTA